MKPIVAGMGGLLFAAAIGLAKPPVPLTKSKARDAFFAEGKIPHLVLEVGKAEADSLRREPRKYVRSKLRDGNQEYPDVGIHLRGSAGSFRGFDDKPGLTLNMDKFVDGQRYHGLDKFHLANSAQDPSYLSEYICGEICRVCGVPAARISQAVVTLNGRKLGMFYLKEGYDKEFLRRHFKNATGNFYDGGFCRDIDQPLDLISGKGDVTDRKDLKALLAAGQENDPVKRFQKLEKVLDLDAFISYMVVTAFTWDWDSYAFKANNYRIYHHPERDKLYFIPSGMDQMFADPSGPFLPGFQGFVSRRLMETPEGKKRYIARMREVMATAIKPDELVKKLDEAEKRVQPELAALDANAGRDYKNHVERLRRGIRDRAKSIQDQLKHLK